MELINKILNRTKNESKSFFDYPAKEKKRILVEAVHEANKMQLALVGEYNKRFSR